MRRLHAMFAEETLADRVEGAGSNIAVNNADGSQRQREETVLRFHPRRRLHDVYENLMDCLWGIACEQRSVGNNPFLNVGK